MPTAEYPVNPHQPGQITAEITTTRNAITPVVGYREDLAAGDVMVASLTNAIGVVSYKWQLLGRPEGSVAGGLGPEPISLGFAPTATFTVDDDSGAFPRDGTYILQCLVNERSPTETRLRVGLVRLNPLTMLDGRTLRLLGAFESSEDTADENVRAGFAKMGNRLLRIVLDVPSSPDGLLIGDPQTLGVFTGPRPDNIYLAGMRRSDPNDVPAAVPASGDMLYAVPIFTNTGGVISTLLIKQRGGTTGSVRLGLYSNIAKAAYPNQLLFDSGDLNFTGTSLLTAAANRRVAPGLYWLVLLFNAAAVSNAVQVDHLKSQAMFPLLGIAADLAAVNFGVGWRHAQAFGALPATFPTSAPVQLQPGLGGLNIPSAYFRWDL